MQEKPDASTALGLELEGDLLKAVQISYVKGKPRLDRLFEISVGTDHVNPLYKSENNQDLQNAIQKSLVITSLNTQEVLIRQLEIKLKKDKDLQEVLLFQAEPLLPYPAENAVLDYLKIGTTEEGTLLSVFAARKDHLQQHLAHWAKFQIEPEVITAVPAALANFADFSVSADQPYCIAHLGLQQTTCVLIQEGNLTASQSVPLGIIHLKQALSHEGEAVPGFGDIDISNLTEESHPALYQAWDAMRLEIKRAIFSLSKQARGQPVKELLITGSGALVPHLASTLALDLDMQQIFPRQELFSNLTVGQILNFAIPIGEALSAFPTAKNKINFRQGELSYPHPWKRLKNSILLYAGLCVALALAFYLFGQAYLSYRQDQVRQSYVQLLTIMNKPYDDFEKEFENKNPETKPSDGVIAGIMQLNDAGLFQRVEYLEKELQSTPDLFPLWPNVPKVSDVLAWLSTQHVSVAKKGKVDARDAQSLQIESFNYALVKRPEQNKKQEKYQVKVEIEFTSPTPKQARAFHDALIEPNAFVDPKGEVKWNSSHGRYRTSFFLKDKTFYPQG